MQYHSEEFLIVKKLKKFIIDLEKIIVNFPRKDFLTKDKIYKDALDTLELVFIANSVNSYDKKSLQVKILAKISMLDFYLERAYKNKYINEKQCIERSKELAEITKMVYKWVHNA